MRCLSFLILAGATMLAAAPAMAQRYDPRYPVCLERWEWGGSIYYDCAYTAWDQCRAASAGLSAMCVENPYWAGAHQAAPGRFYRGQGRAY
jgi:hypothetical protein